MDHKIEELEAQIQTLQRRLEEAQAQAIRAEQDRDRVTIESGFRDAIARSKVPVQPAALTDVLKRATTAGDWKLDPQHGLIRLDGGLPAINADGDYVTPARWLQALAKEAPHLFAAADTGTAGAAQANPFSPGPGFSLTAQGDLYRRDPKLAAELAAKAGRTLNDGV